MKKRILLIDGDQMLNKINEKVLFSAGIASELHIVQNGDDALTYLHGRLSKNYPLPDLIIMDLKLPEQDGFDFMDDFESMNFPGKSKIEIIVFTASSSVKDKQRAMSKGIRHFISKPYLVRGLMDVLARIAGPRPISGMAV
jgi:CheY-like chemotaxis protein